MATTKLKDVADDAGVSLATVSRVLNNNPRVKAELRDRVQYSVRKLDYRPNRAARRLRARDSNIIGLIISDIQNPFFLSAIRAIEESAYAQQMSLILCNSDEQQDRQALYLDWMVAEQVAGMILVPTPYTTADTMRQIQQSGLAVVLLDRDIANFPADMVKVDNYQGAYQAAAYLVELGYRRISIITPSPGLATSTERYRGYEQALLDAGIAIDPILVEHGDSKAESGYQCMQRLTALDPRPEAVFIGNNMMTLGALRALREASLRVPEDIALVGFDDMPWSGDLYSPLTAVSQPSARMGQEAFKLLHRRVVEPQAAFRTITLQTELIVRESCGARLRQRAT